MLDCGMAKTPAMRNAEFFMDGVRVGHFTEDQAQRMRLAGEKVEIHCDFTPNWPGIWHAMALSLDKPKD